MQEWARWVIVGVGLGVMIIIAIILAVIAGR
jgi:hypothetical protein